MAQRYGRKRKRAHLAKITALEEANEREGNLLRRVSGQLRELQSEMEQWDAEIRRQFGEYSAVRRQTPTIQSSHSIRDVPVREPVSGMWSADIRGVTTMPMMIKQRMRRFVFESYDDAMTMSRHMRFIEQDGKGGVAYSISDPALRPGFGSREVEYLARTIAESMARHFNDKSKG